MKHPQTVTVYPEKNENKAAYLLWRSLRAALLTAGALIALMVIWNVDLKGLFVLPLGGAVTVLLGCIAGDYLGAKKEHIPCRGGCAVACFSAGLLCHRQPAFRRYELGESPYHALECGA